MEKIGILKSKKLFLPHKTNRKNFNSHIWFKQNGKNYMFKYSAADEFLGRSFLNEMLVSQMCKFIGIPCQEATLARHALSNVNGAKIRSFLNGDECEISMENILDEKCNALIDDGFGKNFLEKNIYPYIPKTQKEATALRKKKPQTSTGLESVDGKFPTKISLEDIEIDSQNKIRLLVDIYLSKTSPAAQELFGAKVINAICSKMELINRISTEHNESKTIETLTSLAKEYASIHGYTLDENFEKRLAQMLLFDYVVAQTDRHLGNISFILSGNTLRFAPLFDNGHCLLFKSNSISHESHVQFHTRITQELLKSPNARSTITKIDTFLNAQFDDFIEHLQKNSPEILELAPHYKKFSKTAKHDSLNRSPINTQFAQSTFVPSDEEIKNILSGNTKRLESLGIQYSPELWLKTYLYACKQIMCDHIDELKFMYKNVNNAKFADSLQK